MKKYKNKKFINLDSSQYKTKTKYAQKWKSFSYMQSIQLKTSEESDFFILLTNNAAILYNKNNLSLIDQLVKCSNSIIINNNTLFIEKYNLNQYSYSSAIYIKLNNKFQFLKMLNLGKSRINQIVKYKNNKLIIHTFKEIQIWSSKIGIPDSCISILKINSMSCFMMNNNKILVVNEVLYKWQEDENISFWDIKTLKKIYHYENKDDIGLEAKKLNKEKIILIKKI